MERDLLESWIDAGLSTRKMAAKAECSQGKVKYWLAKHNLKTQVLYQIDKPLPDVQKCKSCGKLKEGSEFYQRRSKGRNALYSACKECLNKETLLRQKKFKLQCLEYMGGKCELCSYSKYIGALEFHHRDPSQKDFNIGSVRSRKFSIKIQEELDKCALLCSNCHKEEHARLLGEDI